MLHVFPEHPSLHHDGAFQRSRHQERRAVAVPEQRTIDLLQGAISHGPPLLASLETEFARVESEVVVHNSGVASSRLW